MAVLRRDGEATHEVLLALDTTDPERVARCEASLVADGLAVHSAERLRLP